MSSKLIKWTLPGKGRFLVLLGLLACLVGVAGYQSPAQATISLTPYSIVIDGRERFAEVTLINTGKVPVTYDLGWRFLEQREGAAGYVQSDHSVTDFDLTKHIVFTPRRVTLAPGEAQKVRLALRLGGEPPAPGDYRAHLSFVQSDSISPKGETGESEKLSVGVSYRVGLSMPVIYRVGETTAGAEIGNVTLTRHQDSGKPQLIVPIERSEGPYGITGYLTVYHTPADGGPELVVGELANAFLFPEIRSRDFAVAIMPGAEQRLGSGTLRVVYEDRIIKNRTKPEKVLAERVIPIGN